LATSEHDVLRVSAIGSVDDGKSTLIGRLLLETQQVTDDQLDAVRRASVGRGDGDLDLSLFTDGLRAEREQGITIDVAYRYFRTKRRSFVMADCPGHPSYTRNMVTGTGGADCALLLIDAAGGLTEQTRRHAFIAAWLRVPHVIVCVNKMDLVGYDEQAFETLREEYTQFSARLDIPDLTFVPVSALRGDNVSGRSENMPWYEGPSLLYALEHVHIASDRDLVDVRFPVQLVLRAGMGSPASRRAYCGQLSGGVMRPQDEIIVLPTMTRSRIARIGTLEGDADEAYPPMNLRLELEEELEVSRGYMIARPENMPTVTSDVEAMICCLADTRIEPGATLELQQTSRNVRALVDAVRYRLDIRTLHRELGAAFLGLNDIGRVHLRLTSPIFCDPYERNRTTGSFILVDETDHRTVAAGVVLARNVDTGEVDRDRT
jgi:bifunctional enzyme CysN/CysC